MKHSVCALFVSALFFVVGSADADSTEDFRDANRIIVVTDDEAIHYASFCGFYELRDLLVESVANVSDSVTATGDPKFEIRVLAKSGERKAYIGDHWISTEHGTALIPTATYERIVRHVEMRKGQGQPKGRLNRSIQQILGRMNDPAHAEQNMCPTR